ncbi:MAG TPA: translocation/assembly module TamB domain-containing protein [Vicinamibacterales bacterium]|nr:translocation/assembly module TamB domain-containing protein [Vicinamibacterales bacterium]
MTLVRRVLHIVAWIGTLFVALVAFALIASQTPWFRDWVRRAIVREAKQYLNGELTIGRLGGNFFFGVSLADVAVDVSGDRVIAVKALNVDYSIFDLISRGISIDRIVVTAPAVHAVRDARGWNLGRLVKKQQREAEREGPGRPVSLPAISIADGSATIDDRVGSTVYQLPRRIDDLDIEAGFEYAPVHYSIELRRLNLVGATPDILLRELSGGIAVRDDNLFLERMHVKTAETSLAIDGVVEQYLRTPIIKLVTDGSASLPEIARILKPIAGYELHPTLRVKTDGPLDRLKMDLDVTSEAGLVRGQVTADFKPPDIRFAGGPVHVEHLNLGPIFKTPSQRSDITGDATFDVAILSIPSDAPALDRLDGTFKFRGPRVIAFGYDASQVSASGTIKGPKIALADARVNAYGAAATTSGFIVLPQGKRAVAYDLQGTADGVDLRRLPRALRIPRLATRLFLSAYHVRGTGTAASGTAAFRTSEVEGATISDGTTGEFDFAPGRISYGARGTLSNLDVRRLGRGLEVAALDKPLYDGRVNGTFDVKGSGTAIETLDLAATGTLTDSTMAGMHVPEMAFDARIADAGLTVTAKGAFDQLNPAVLSGREAVNGNVNGRVDGTFSMPDLSADFTPASFAFNGRVTLDSSLVGGVQIAGADVQGRYEQEVADFDRLQIKGPDVTVDASGRLALDRSSNSNLTYHVDARDLTEVGRIAGQESLRGAAILDGSVSGNAESLQTKGTLRGSGLEWRANKVLSVEAAYDVAAPDLDFVNAKVQATTNATFVEAAGVQINEITATTTYAQKHLEFDTKVQERTRQLDARGSVIFHPDHQEIHLPQLAIRTEGIEWRSVRGGDPAIQYGRDQIILKDIKLASGEQTLDVAGALPLKDGQASGALEVHARNVDLAQLERLLLQNRGLLGRLTADATITGSTSRPVVDGHVEVVGGGFQGYRYDSLVADVDYGGNKIALDATLQQSAGVAITAKGTVPTTLFERSKGEHVAATGEDSIDLRIQTPGLNLGVVQGFTTQVTNVQGTLQADVRVIGSGHDPHLDGFVEIRDGAFAVPRGGTSYSGLDTRIDLSPDSVRIRRFEILDENGEQLAVAGQLAVHERKVGAVDISLESQNFEAIDNELGDIGVGTKLRISGELLRPRLDGDIRIAAGRLEVDRLLQFFYDPYRTEELPSVVSAEAATQAAGSAREATQGALAQAATRGAGAAPGAPAAAEAKAAETAAPGGAFENLTLDVHVKIPDNLVLRGRRLRPGGPTRASIGDINITVGGDLDIKKDPGGSVTVAGVVTMIRGTYTFQGRQFDIARGGTLRFAGEPDNPIVDITAVRQIPDTGVEARVRITGTVSNPELHLSSTPPLDESDVLSLIVFNRPINELGTGERTSLAATAGGIATGFIATPLGESIGRALDLDLFEITTTAEGDTLGAGVTVGEQIGDRTFFKLRQQFGDRTYSEFLLEYQIRDFLRLVGSAAPETSGAGNRIGQHRIEQAGMDLIFFFSY